MSDDMERAVTKSRTELTLLDKLSRLSYSQTLKLLGSDAPKLLRAGAKWDLSPEEHAYLGEDLFRLQFPLAAGDDESARVAITIRSAPESNGRLHWNCTACDSLCEHVGAAFSLILDEKMALGLCVGYANVHTELALDSAKDSVSANSSGDETRFRRK